jgi:hypothetical protein
MDESEKQLREVTIARSIQARKQKAKLARQQDEGHRARIGAW